MQTIALLSALAATLSTVSAQVAYASAGANVNVNVAATAVAVAGNNPPVVAVVPAVVPAVAVVTASPPVVTAPYVNVSCPTCLVTTIYQVTYVSVCPTAGLTYVPYTITTACPGGCVINYAVVPAGFQTTVLQCGVCATPGPVTVTVPIAPVIAVPTVTTTVYAVANCPAVATAVVAPPVVATPVVVVGCPGGASCPVTTPRNGTYLFTSAASMATRWEGMAVVAASVVLGMLLM